MNILDNLFEKMACEVYRHSNKYMCVRSYSLPSGQKSCSNSPPISTEIPLLKDKFHLQSNTVHTFHREICCDDTCKLLLKTLWKELFTNKGEILSCKSVKPCKNQKNSGSITSEQEINPVQILHPSKATFKFPLPGLKRHSQMPGVCPQGMLKFRIDRRIILTSHY